MKHIFIFFWLFLWFFCVKSAVLAQDSSKENGGDNSFIQLYINRTGLNSRIYSGFAVSLSFPHIKGSAYFLDSLYFGTGSVNYQNLTYDHVPLLYNVYQDILISKFFDNGLNYGLIPEKISYFEVQGHKFFRISQDTTNLTTGFYEEVYDRKTRVLVRYEKKVQSRSGQEAGNYFETIITWFLKKGNRYYRISGESDLLDLFKDRNRELSQYLTANHLKFKSDPKLFLINAAAYYDHLSD